MLFYKKITLTIALFGLFQIVQGQTPTAGELIGVHQLTQTEINAIANPIIGTLVYNTDENTMQTYTGGAWAIPESISTFVDNNDGTFTYTDESNTSVTIGTIGPQGPIGPQGIQGIQGEKGDTGDTGPQGIQGIQGATGDPGAQGIQGIKGDIGDTGAQGIQGLPGVQGATGAQGIQGPPGPDTVTNLSQASATGIITYTNEDNTSQTANVISTNANNIIAAGTDGGAFLANKIIDVYDSNNSYTVSTNTFRRVRFNTTRINQGGIYTLNNEQITVSEAGTYEIDYGVTARTNVWSYLEARLRVNGVDLPATSSYNGGWYKNSTATRKIYQTLNANDVVSVWVQRLDYTNSGGNSVTTIDDGSSLLIRKLN